MEAPKNTSKGLNSQRGRLVLFGRSAQSHTLRVRLFPVLLSVAIAIRILYVIVLPHGQGVRWRLEGLNDEPSHYNYVKYLAKHRSFPVQTMTVKDPDAMKISEFEYYQPPLYYLLCAPLTAAAGERAGLYLGRIVSFLLGVASIFLLGWLFRLLGYPSAAARAAMLFLAFLPTHAYFSSVVSNDALCWFLSLAATSCLVRLVGLPADEASGTAGRRTGALLCVLLTALMYTKSSASIFFPLTAATYLLLWWRHRTPVVAAHGLAVLAAAGLACLPWYLRNLHLYHSLFALDLGFGSPSPAVRTILDIPALARVTMRFFWFPMLHLREYDLPVLVLHCAGGAFAMVCAALGIVYFRRQRRIRAGEAVLLLALGLTCAAYVNLHLTWSNPEARFLFPALAGIIWVFVVPLWDYASRTGRGPWVPAALCGAALYPYLYLFFVNH